MKALWKLSLGARVLNLSETVNWTSRMKLQQLLLADDLRTLHKMIWSNCNGDRTRSVYKTNNVEVLHQTFFQHIQAYKTLNHVCSVENEIKAYSNQRMEPEANMNHFGKYFSETSWSAIWL